MKHAEVLSLFALAQIRVTDISQIVNPYWPANSHFDDMRERFPWWSVRVEGGVINLGWRKRVISIDWRLTDRRGLVTEDDVTKDDNCVHAWSFAKAVEYLSHWSQLPRVAVTTPNSKEFTLHGKEEVLQVFRIHEITSPEGLALKSLIEASTDDAPIVMTITSAGGYHAYNLRIGKLSIAYHPQ